jgi:hypothetical protein
MIGNRVRLRWKADMKAVAKIAVRWMHREAGQQETQKPRGMDVFAWLPHTPLFHELNQQGEATLASPCWLLCRMR